MCHLAHLAQLSMLSVVWADARAVRGHLRLQTRNEKVPRTQVKTMIWIRGTW